MATITAGPITYSDRMTAESLRQEVRVTDPRLAALILKAQQVESFPNSYEPDEVYAAEGVIRLAATPELLALRVSLNGYSL